MADPAASLGKPAQVRRQSSSSAPYQPSGSASWEPETKLHVSNMDDVKERIQNVTQELRSKGKLISGRTIIACHTLPYTCCLVEDEENDKMAPDLTLEIRRADNRTVGIHTPEPDTPEPAKGSQTPNQLSTEGREPAPPPLKPLPHHLQPQAQKPTPPAAAGGVSPTSQAAAGAATPKSILVNPMESAGSSGANTPGSGAGSHSSHHHAHAANRSGISPPPPLTSSGSFVDLIAAKTAAYEQSKQQEEEEKAAKAAAAATKDGAHKPSRWVLCPRRGHAALNSGIRAMSQSADVTLVAWPGDMRRGSQDQPELEGFGDLAAEDLTPELKKDLDNGLAAMGGVGKGPRCRPVWVDSQTSKLFYDGYCKTFLWPLFHYFSLSDHISKATEASTWKAYVAANEAYAQAIIDTYQPGDMIWVEDYHLMLVPRIVRSKLPDAAIGFFLHSPFPSSEIFRCLPRRENILDGLLGADLCAFQTWSYGRHFLSSCVRVMGYETSSDGMGHVNHHGSLTHIRHCPIGIDAERCDQDRKKPGVLPKMQALRELYSDKKIVVGRDKLDPTKGVIAKLQAYERLLQDCPHWAGKTVLMLVTSPSPTESLALGTKVSEMVDHINGLYGSLRFQPVHHYHQTIDRDEYFALLSVADLALVTSIRDGMNTTCMEYAICQSETKNPLILSEYCGIATSLNSAIRINPWDLTDCARQIDYCLTMSDEEKAARHSDMHKRVTTHTAAVWQAELSLMLLEARLKEEATHHTADIETPAVVKAMQQAKKRVMFFDYDGTLTPIVKTPEAAVPSKECLEVLTRLAADPKNILYIVSGRDRNFLSQHLGHIPNLGFSAEHGCFLKLPSSTEWTNLTDGLDMSWRADVEDIFRYYEVRTTGATVEKKAAAITFHHRNADPEWGEFQAKECQAILESMQERLDIDVMVGKRNLEVRPAHTNKGEIVKRLLGEHPDAEFALCIGDDKTDEDMFRAMRSLQSLIQDRQAGRATIEGQHSRVAHVGDSSLIEAESDPLKTPPAAMAPENIFTLVVDTNVYRKTIAEWHVNEPEDVLNLLDTLGKEA